MGKACRTAHTQSRRTAYTQSRGYHNMTADTAQPRTCSNPFLMNYLIDYCPRRLCASNSISMLYRHHNLLVILLGKFPLLGLRPVLSVDLRIVWASSRNMLFERSNASSSFDVASFTLLLLVLLNPLDVAILHMRTCSWRRRGHQAGEREHAVFSYTTARALHACACA